MRRRVSHSISAHYPETLIGYGTTAHLREELSSARSLLHSGGQPHSVRLPIGVGYLGWKLDEAGEKAYPFLDAALQSNVRAIWLSFGHDLGRWVDYIRDNDKETGRKTYVFIQVNSLEEALKAVNIWKADVLVAQGTGCCHLTSLCSHSHEFAGIEAGGHGGGYAPPVFSLVSSILAAIPQGCPPVLAAGGIANGTQIAAFLALGASGAVLGTRFLLTPEAQYTGPQKAALISADSTSTVRTLAFDRARGTLGWPEGIDGRGLRNQLVEDIENDTEIETVKSKFAEATKFGLPDYSIIWAGTGVGEMHELMDAQVGTLVSTDPDPPFTETWFAGCRQGAVP